MTAYKGRDMLLKIGTLTSPETFATVGGIRSNKIQINNAPVDVTSDTNAPWRVLLGDAGLRTVSITGSGVFEADAPIETIEGLAFSGALQDFEIQFGNGEVWRGSFQVTSFEYTGTYNGEQTYSITLDSAGQIFQIG